MTDPIPSIPVIPFLGFTLILLRPTAAAAAWGQNWGEMPWGPVLIPALSALAVAALAIGLGWTGWTLLRRRRPSR